MTKAKAKAAAKRVNKNWLEWIVFGLSLTLVVGVLGFLAYDGMRAKERAPEIEVTLGAPEQRGQDFVVPVSVRNRGDQTAEGVQVEVTLEASGAEPERGEFTIAFLPRRATREGWVAFRTDPRGARLTPRVLGYEKP